MWPDSRRFPLTAGYFAQLPQGLSSFPQCRVHHDAFAGLPELLGEHVKRDLPHSVAQFFGPEPATRGWIPEVVGQLAIVLLADAVGEDALLEHARASATLLYQRPILRHLMGLLSPTLVALGASARWSALRRGTTLVASPVYEQGSRKATRVKLAGPDGIFSEVFARSMEGYFEVAVQGARGSNPAVHVADFASSEIHYIVSWDR